LREAGHRAFIKPLPLPEAVPGGLTYDDFDINLQAGTATCPAGHTRRIPKSRRINFEVHCRDCPLRARCTSSPKGRWITVHERDDLLRQPGSKPKQSSSSRPQRLRPMVERGISWLTRAGNRRLRYRGVTKNDQWLQHRMAALNLRRLVNLGLTRLDGAWAVI
jgi:hypothetical protein